MESVINRLLDSEEPSIRYKVRVQVVGEDPQSASIKALRREIPESPRVRRLLSNQRPDGRIEPLGQVYRKWIGAHWILTSLADIGYPPGQQSLAPAVGQVLDCWLHPEAIRERVYEGAPPARRRREIPVIDGRARRCASQQGNALFASVTLGFMTEATHRLAECLLRWQWPDGGWNCDRKAEAIHSSFWESLIPLRGLSLYARVTGELEARAAAERTADIFLKRRLYRRQTDGEIIHPQFVRLHYPCYWRYDILFALKVMAEAGFISDDRCREALDLLVSKELPEGGWPAEERFYKPPGRPVSGSELVSWGGVGKKRMNEWVTADALTVLKAAGRLDGVRKAWGPGPRARHSDVRGG